MQGKQLRNVTAGPVNDNDPNTDSVAITDPSVFLTTGRFGLLLDHSDVGDAAATWDLVVWANLDEQKLLTGAAAASRWVRVGATVAAATTTVNPPCIIVPTIQWSLVHDRRRPYHVYVQINNQTGAPTLSAANPLRLFGTELD